MSTLNGSLWIAAQELKGGSGQFKALAPATGKIIEPAFGLAGKTELNAACAAAEAAFDSYRETSLEKRASFLENIAGQIIALGDELIERAMLETGLPQARLQGERARTVGQLRLFADVVREGSWLHARIDPAQPQRQPQARNDLRQRHIALGPVAVFGASNFPLAFSVAGGDTASALAAGCPVLVKAHNAHPGTSELVARAISLAVRQSDLPGGVFSLLFFEGNELAGDLVADPRIKAVGFTGSRSGGLALSKIAAAREEPIPVYAEMSAINPVYLLPDALKRRAATLGQAFANSLTMGAGQFCTNPGLLLAIDSPELETFVAAAAQTLGSSPAGLMLTPGIAATYAKGVAGLQDKAKVKQLALGQGDDGPNRGQAAFFSVQADDFLADPSLQSEIFGAASLLVRVRDQEQLLQVSERLEGQLTATLQLDSGDTEVARRLLPILERKAGRILANGWPTGVEVCHAMVHGGPFPATSDSRGTSVGSLAIERFLRPVCYQDLPVELLPEALAPGNPLHIWRRVDGLLGRD